MGLAKLYQSPLRWLPLAAAILTTLIWLNAVPNIPVSDQDIYHRTAISVANGQGLLDDSGRPTSYWAPGYTFYLAFFYYLFGHHLSIAFWANGLSYLFLIIGIYLFTKALVSKETGWLAATISAWYPSFIFYTTILASELFFLALLIWGLYFCQQCAAVKSKNFVFAVLGGLFLGGAILTRPQALAIPPIFLLMGFIQKKKFSWIAVQFAVLLITIFLVLLPWGLRNKQKLGEFILVSANFGANLWIGNHPSASGKFETTKEIEELNKRNDLTLTEKDKILRNKALDFILNNPGNFLMLAFKRIYWTMRSESIAVVWNIAGIEKAFGHQWILPLKIIANFFYYLLWVGVFWGIVKNFRNEKFSSSDGLLLCLILLLSLPFLIFQAQDRFHLPLIPFLIIFVSKALDPDYRRS